MNVKDVLKEKLNIDVTISAGAWHTNYEEKYGLSITDTKSGCGSMILSGYKNTQPSRFSAFLEIIIPELIENGDCVNKVPDEGICINNESKNQILKLKSKRFLLGETQALDNIKEEDYVE